MASSPFLGASRIASASISTEDAELYRRLGIEDAVLSQVEEGASVTVLSQIVRTAIQRQGVTKVYRIQSDETALALTEQIAVIPTLVERSIQQAMRQLYLAGSAQQVLASSAGIPGRQPDVPQDQASDLPPAEVQEELLTLAQRLIMSEQRAQDILGHIEAHSRSIRSDIDAIKAQLATFSTKGKE